MLQDKKKDDIHEQMQRLGIEEKDLIEKFILGSGKGGQKINKTSSCVYLKHIPSGMEVKCQRSRSREDNRLLARRELCEKMEEKREGIRSEKQQKIEKIRRQKRRRSRKAQQKVLEGKKHLSQKKNLRKSPGNYQ